MVPPIQMRSRMQKTISISLSFICALTLAGCNEHASSPGEPMIERARPAVSADYRAGAGQNARMSAQSKAQRSAAIASAESPADQPVEEKRIAEAQTWHFEVISDKLEGVWKTHHELCALRFAQHCEVVQASVSTGQGARHANLEMRVARPAFDQFMTALSDSGTAPIEKTVSREDRTLQWVDLQARKENAEKLRDRLQAMVANHRTDKLSDLLSLERELNRVQSTLDSMQSQARVMSRDTEKVRLSFHYGSAPQTAIDDVWRPIRDAWHGMGRTFAMSLGSVLLFLAGVVPWVFILVPAWFLVRGGFRALRRRLARRRG